MGIQYMRIKLKHFQKSKDRGLIADTETIVAIQGGQGHAMSWPQANREHHYLVVSEGIYSHRSAD